MYKFILKVNHPDLGVKADIECGGTNRDKVILDVTKHEDKMRKLGYITQLYELVKVD